MKINQTEDKQSAEFPELKNDDSDHWIEQQQKIPFHDSENTRKMRVESPTAAPIALHFF